MITLGCSIQFARGLSVRFVLPIGALRSNSTMASIVRKIIHTAKCPKAVAPYNQAVVADRTVYCSGVLGMELGSLKLVEGGAAGQTAKALEHLTTLLEASGSSIEKVVKTTILLADMNDYGAVNDEYKRVFSNNFPARTCFAVNKLPLGAAVEIEAIALTGEVIQVST
ncbi:rutC family protein UK114-like [Armigeres subalbatus]|uniref:rutC family protein UK114-like n=1 Tax=Armigeres subalbatus TaxID=124917 RepID=UPI002ED4F15F